MAPEEIQALLQESEETLFHRLGEQVVSRRHASLFTPPSVFELIEMGKKYFYDVRESVRSAICSNETIRKCLDKDRELDNVQIVLAVAAILARFDWLPAAQVSILSVILVRRGLEAYCKQTNDLGEQS